MMFSEIVSNKNQYEWDDYVNSNPAATNYHQFRWKDVIEKSFGHETIYLWTKDENNRVVGILPTILMTGHLFGTFLISLPFFNYGGLLCNSDSVAFTLLEEAKKIMLMKGASFLELRHMKDYGFSLITRKHKVTMILRLENDPLTQRDRFNSKLRNQIKKSEKNDLTITAGHLDMLDDFYNVFARNMRDLGTPVYQKKFFRNILELFPHTTKIFVVTFKKKVIAVAIATWYKDAFEIPWSASLIYYRSLCPNDLLYWGAIKYAIQKGFEKFDFGRSSPGSGAYKFKEQWGPNTTQLYWQYYLNGITESPEINPLNPKYATAIRLWRLMPVWLTKIMGPKIARGIP